MSDCVRHLIVIKNSHWEKLIGTLKTSPTHRQFWFIQRAWYTSSSLNNTNNLYCPVQFDSNTLLEISYLIIQLNTPIFIENYYWVVKFNHATFLTCYHWLVQFDFTSFLGNSYWIAYLPWTLLLACSIWNFIFLKSFYCLIHLNHLPNQNHLKYR